MSNQYQNKTWNKILMDFISEHNLFFDYDPNTKILIGTKKNPKTDLYHTLFEGKSNASPTVH